MKMMKRKMMKKARKATMTEEITIKPIVDKSNGIVSIKDYEAVLANATAFISENSVFVKPNFEDSAEIKACKKERTELNRVQKNLTSARLAICDNLTGEFVRQCKQLEKLCKEASDRHSLALKEYEDYQKQFEKTAEEAKPTPTVYSVVVSSLDAEAIEAVKKYAVKKGCKING